LNKALTVDAVFEAMAPSSGKSVIYLGFQMVPKLYLSVFSMFFLRFMKMESINMEFLHIDVSNKLTYIGIFSPMPSVSSLV
jgi:hypothetical protein